MELTTPQTKNPTLTETALNDKLDLFIQTSLSIFFDEDDDTNKTVSQDERDTIVRQCLQSVKQDMTQEEYTKLIIDTISYMSVEHPKFSFLSARIALLEIYENTPSTFSSYVETLFHNHDEKTKRSSPLVSSSFYDNVMKNKHIVDSHIKMNRDYRFDIFALRTMEKSYLLRVNNKIHERPQYMFMRVALGIHENDIAKALETYDYMSTGCFIHATPTLFNAGREEPQLSSCFLLPVEEDSIEGIYNTIKQSALISKHAGGVGISVSNVRAAGSYIRGSGGTSNGLTPMLRVLNSTARYVDQGGGKRKGSFAIYLEPWHADVFDFLDLRKNTGVSEIRARDLFYGLWIPDLFMKRVISKGKWTLFCPSVATGLDECHGEEFERLYEKYENTVPGKEINAEELWGAIIKSQVETGGPYMMYKDSCNEKSNHNHLGAIKTSNLCTEIVQHVSKDETAVCTLASVSLPAMIKNKGIVEVLEDGRDKKYGDVLDGPDDLIDSVYDFQKLFDIVRVIVYNLNNVIDINKYPTQESARSALAHRAIGIGVQGLADVFASLGVPYDSSCALKLDRDIFETIYFSACCASVELARQFGPYSTYEGSLASEGKLQPDLWNEKPSLRWNWEQLRDDIGRYGMRNSLLVAPMPTASTSQILGNTECFEPFTSNLYTRRCLSGEFVVLNKHMVRDLERYGLWNENTRTAIIQGNGSLQGIAYIPEDIKNVYKTVWEIRQKNIIDHARARAPFIDQSQSMNAYIDFPTLGKVSSMHVYAWKQGLKTGMYYLRGKPAANAVQFTTPVQAITGNAGGSNSSDNSDNSDNSDTDSGSSACEMCSS